MCWDGWDQSTRLGDYTGNISESPHKDRGMNACKKQRTRESFLMILINVVKGDNKMNSDMDSFLLGLFDLHSHRTTLLREKV